MLKQRIHNFNPGPAALPLAVLEEIQSSFLDFKGTGMSIIEISHRSSAFEEILNDAILRAKRLLALDERFHVLFLQGGASLQFCMIPMNFLPDNRFADYIHTGSWSGKALSEVRILGKHANIIASSEDRGFSYIPKQFAVNPEACYLHLTSNNTIKGTQWARFPETGAVPIIADMSSDMMSRPIDTASFGCIYAGAQKNLGAAGACMVILRQDLIEKIPDTLPTMLSYRTHAAENSLFNTPSCFAVYTVQLVLKWLEEAVGGLAQMAAVNAQKARMLYDVIDAGDFYRGTAESDSRSQMNITFRLPDADLERRFLQEARENGLGGLKGHRSVGGCRASLYNAVSLASVTALADFMKVFQRRYG
jgi:phosphoserine aminotransferase